MDLLSIFLLYALIVFFLYQISPGLPFSISRPHQKLQSQPDPLPLLHCSYKLQCECQPYTSYHHAHCCQHCLFLFWCCPHPNWKLLWNPSVKDSHQQDWVWEKEGGAKNMRGWHWTQQVWRLLRLNNTAISYGEVHYNLGKCNQNIWLWLGLDFEKIANAVTRASMERRLWLWEVATMKPAIKLTLEAKLQCR